MLITLLKDTEIISRFAAITLRKTELVTLLLLYSGCHVTVIVLYLFLAVLCVILLCVILAFPCHPHLLYE